MSCKRHIETDLECITKKLKVTEVSYKRHNETDLECITKKLKVSEVSYKRKINETDLDETLALFKKLKVEETTLAVAPKMLFNYKDFCMEKNIHNPSWVS